MELCILDMTKVKLFHSLDYSRNNEVSSPCTKEVVCNCILGQFGT